MMVNLAYLTLRNALFGKALTIKENAKDVNKRKLKLKLKLLLQTHSLQTLQNWLFSRMPSNHQPGQDNIEV